jgi:tetratricopeptide (TPR) repeat protein
MSAADAARALGRLEEALNNRGNVLRDQGHLLEALASFDAALTAKPDFPLAHCNRGQTLQACDWRDLGPLTERLIALLGAGTRATHPMSLLSLSDAPELQLACAQSLVRDFYPENPTLGPCPRRPFDGDGRRLRAREAAT